MKVAPPITVYANSRGPNFLLNAWAEKAVLHRKTKVTAKMDIECNVSHLHDLSSQCSYAFWKSEVKPVFNAFLMVSTCDTIISHNVGESSSAAARTNLALPM